MHTSTRKLKRFIIDTARTCIHGPAGRLGHQFVLPSYGQTAGLDDEAAVSFRSTVGHYLQMYDWDACFFGQASVRLCTPELPLAIVENFLDQMDGLGYIPRTISPGRSWDGADMCKPFLTQLLFHWTDTTGNRPSTTLLDRISRYLGYYQSMRRGESSLFRWANVLESGVDNNLSLLYPLEASKDNNSGTSDFPDSELLAVDLSSYLAAEYRALSALARGAGQEALATSADAEAAAISHAIEEYLWNGELGIYCNLLERTVERVGVRTWTSLTPVFFGVSCPERAGESIVRNVMCNEHFLRKAGLSSVAASEPIYNQAPRGLYGRFVVSNWQGPMWVLPNVMAVRALLRLGMQQEAQDIALRVIGTLCEDLENTGTLHENYNADTGAPLWAPQFMSWNVLSLELIDLLE